MHPIVYIITSGDGVSKQHVLDAVSNDAELCAALTPEHSTSGRSKVPEVGLRRAPRSLASTNTDSSTPRCNCGVPALRCTGVQITAMCTCEKCRVSLHSGDIWHSCNHCDFDLCTRCADNQLNGVATQRATCLDIPIDSVPPHFHHNVWSMCGRNVAWMWPNSGHVVVTPTTLAPQTHQKGSRFCSQIVVPEPPTIGPH